MHSLQNEAIIVQLETLNINLKLDIKRYIDRLLREGKINEQEYGEMLELLHLEGYLTEA